MSLPLTSTEPNPSTASSPSPQPQLSPFYFLCLPALFLYYVFFFSITCAHAHVRLREKTKDRNKPGKQKEKCGHAPPSFGITLRLILRLTLTRFCNVVAGIFVIVACVFCRSVALFSQITTRVIWEKSVALMQKTQATMTKSFSKRYFYLCSFFLNLSSH